MEHNLADMEEIEEMRPKSVCECFDSDKKKKKRKCNDLELHALVEKNETLQVEKEKLEKEQDDNLTLIDDIFEKGFENGTTSMCKCFDK